MDEIHWQGKPKFWSYDSYLGLIALLIIIPLGIMFLEAFDKNLSHPVDRRDVFNAFYTFALLFLPACLYYYRSSLFAFEANCLHNSRGQAAH